MSSRDATYYSLLLMYPHVKGSWLIMSTFYCLYNSRSHLYNIHLLRDELAIKRTEVTYYVIMAPKCHLLIEQFILCNFIIINLLHFGT